MEPDDSVLIVCKTEHHAWATCPCDRCSEERKRRERPPARRIVRLNCEAAQILGFIPRRSPHGSLARELMLREGLAE